MATDSPSTKATSPVAFVPLRRAFSIDEGSRRVSPGKRLPSQDSPSPAAGIRRRSSTISIGSINEARKSLQSSTDDLLLPKPDPAGGVESHDSSAWHSAPLVFALLPAIWGVVFKNGSSVMTDIMLLGLAAIFLNWSLRLPWDWYHSAQLIRIQEEDVLEAFDEDSDYDAALSFSQTLDEVPEEDVAEGITEPATPTPKPSRQSPARESAMRELYRHEIMALLSCVLFPLLGAYLLHTLRSQLSRPSEGLVSNYNLTIFLLASELRPVSHLVKLIQSRTLHLQRVLNANPYVGLNNKGGEGAKDILRRIEELEARGLHVETTANPDPPLSGKQSAALITEARRTLQPDLDALNRAVRRYEKRATLQAFQTESRLLELESRLSDAISLAAAAANHGQNNRGFTGIIIEWAATAIVLPIQALGKIAGLPFQAAAAIINYGKLKAHSASPEKSRKVVNGKYVANGRSTDGPRPSARILKR